MGYALFTGARPNRDRQDIRATTAEDGPTETGTIENLNRIPLKNRDGRRGRRPSRTEKARHLKNLGRVRGLADRRYGGFQRNLNRLPVPGLLAAKGYFLTAPPIRDVVEMSNLRVWAPQAEYMLAMKCVSARFDSHDLDDTKFLLAHLGIKTVGEACHIIEQYYPRKVIPQKTQYLLEELLT
jgi:hypothetical protein